MDRYAAIPEAHRICISESSLTHSHIDSYLAQMIQTVETELEEELKQSMVHCPPWYNSGTDLSAVRKILRMPSLQWTSVLGIEVRYMSHDLCGTLTSPSSLWSSRSPQTEILQ